VGKRVLRLRRPAFRSQASERGGKKREKKKKVIDKRFKEEGGGTPSYRRRGSLVVEDQPFFGTPGRGKKKGCRSKELAKTIPTLKGRRGESSDHYAAGRKGRGAPKLYEKSVFP